MKIAFVNDTFLQGRGADNVIYELAKRLGKKYEVFIITGNSDIPKENFNILKVNIRKLVTGDTLSDSLTYPINIIKLRREILKLQKKYNFDVFNVHHPALNPAFVGLPTILTWHGSPPNKNIIRVSFNNLILKTIKINKGIVVVSEYLNNKVSKIIRKEKIFMIYNGVSNEFKPNWKDKQYMLFVGRHEPHKKVDELIKLSKDTNFPLIIAGSGPLTEKLKYYAKKIKANKVKFIGKVSRKKLINLYQNCSFFVSASRWEGFGLIFLEAAACGKASIAYSLGSIPEVIKKNKTGFLVENYNEFKEAVEKLIKDKKLRKKMGKEAFKFSKNFSWGKVAKKYDRLLSETK